MRGGLHAPRSARRVVISLALYTHWSPLTVPTALGSWCRQFKSKCVHCELQHTVGRKVVKRLIPPVLTCLV